MAVGAIDKSRSSNKSNVNLVGKQINSIQLTNDDVNNNEKTNENDNNKKKGCCG